MRGSDKKNEKGCFPSLVAAEADGRVGSSSCNLHICRAHDSEPAHSPCSTCGNQGSHPHSFLIFLFPSCVGKRAFSLSSMGRGLKPTSWQSGTVWLLQGTGQPHPAPGAPCQPTHQAPRDIPPHPTASVDTVDSPPAPPCVGSCNSQRDPSNSTFYPSPVPELYPLRYLLSHLPPLPPCPAPCPAPTAVTHP